MVIWVSISVSSILVLLSGESAWVCAFWRLTLSLPILALTALITRTPLNARLSPRNAIASVMAGAFLALHFVTWMESLHLISVALSTTLVVTYPAISALIGHAVMRVKVRRGEVLGLLIALGGVVVALYNGLIGSDISPSWPLGSALAVIGAFAAAGYFSMRELPKVFRDEPNPVRSTSLRLRSRVATAGLNHSEGGDHAHEAWIVALPTGARGRPDDGGTYPNELPA